MILFICCLLDALNIKASDIGSQVFEEPETNNFLTCSPSIVPPGSLEQTTL